MTHDVFISYSSKDKPTADATCATLERHGVRCWIAPRDILPGKTWAGSIVEAIGASRAMVLVFSGHCNTSPQIEREVERAINRGIPIVPMRIEDVQPSDAMEYFISTPHWLDAFTPPLEQHLRRLVEVMRGILSPSNDTATSTNASQIPPGPRQIQESAEQKFVKFFADRPDVIAQIESESQQASADTIAEFERLMLRAELCDGMIHSFNFIPPNELGPDQADYRDRILGLMETRESDNPAARDFIALCRQTEATYGEWQSRLEKYQRVAGSSSGIREEIVALGDAALPLACAHFRKMNVSDGHNALASGFCYSWSLEVELAKIFGRLRYFPALSFMADAIVRHSGEMNGHNDWSLGIIRVVQQFGVPRQVSDECFQRLIGATGSEILKERRERN